jgi:hypothetical protein
MYLVKLALTQKNKFSAHLNASLPQNEQIWNEGCDSNMQLGDPLKLTFHNLIGGPSMKLQTLSMGETSYCLTSQSNKLKNI